MRQHGRRSELIDSADKAFGKSALILERESGISARPRRTALWPHCRIFAAESTGFPGTKAWRTAARGMDAFTQHIAHSFGAKVTACSARNVVSKRISTSRNYHQCKNLPGGIRAWKREDAAESMGYEKLQMA
jgi:hypothetical protein